MNNCSTLFLPVTDTGTPFHIILAEKVTPPAADHIINTLDNSFVSRRKIHPLRPKRPRRKSYMCCDSLVAFGTVPNPENDNFSSTHKRVPSLFPFPDYTIFDRVREIV
jgi:hypothetical protein